MTKGRDRRPSPGEARLWRRAMQGVDALPGRRAPAPEEEVPLAAEPAAPPAPPAAAPPPALPALGHGRMPGVDKRTAQRLKRGQLAIEARLDLHGCVRDEARRALGAFIAGARAAGQRCVLVITGKGTRPGAAAGVLRGAVPGWLNEADLRPQVLSFCYAAARHGGEGALYVLLRRKGRS